ncbi:MAG: polyprenyl synthetase family protein [Gemmatimonadetes bacterium]|nr:polyprenyl synthetase family protein [Gemmatimonadota bacterium]
MSTTAPTERGPTDFDLDAFLSSAGAQVEAALAAVAGDLPLSVPSALRDPLLYALQTRGKRLRPILCVAAYTAVQCDAPGDTLYRLACAIEVVHTYSLVHDDLPCMDDDDLRRGRPTVHRVYGVPLAVTAGASLLPMAVRMLNAESAALGLNVAERARLVMELCRAAGAEGMVGGQLLDLEGEESPADGVGLETIHRAKTGALLAAALRIGAMAGRASEPRIAALTAYGEALGLAFQIADDILDVTADSAVLGKTAGKDEAVGKSTYPALYGLDGARALARQRSREAVLALKQGGIRSPALEALAGFVVERRR